MIFGSCFLTNMKIGFLSLIIFFRIFSLEAQELEVIENKDLSIKDSRVNWTIGFTTLEGIELSAENYYLVNSMMS